MEDQKKAHWENVYASKSPHEVSWTQAKPQSSLQLIASAGLTKDAKIIDVGGGDSLLVDFLLHKGYENISVLDISMKSLQRAQKRLGVRADKVTWIESDILDFKPSEVYDLWHDRAVFHFLTSKEDIQRYKAIASQAISKDLILATFSTEGPLRCSGLDITQYNSKSIQELFDENFSLVESFYEDHRTPFDTKQNFVFAHLRRL